MSDPISAIGAWLEALFLGWGWAPHLVTAIMKFIGSLAVIIFAVGLVIITIWMERKLYARIQDRLGPNRVGPWGIFQTFPDMVKIFTKEYITPQGADVVVYNLAPILEQNHLLTRLVDDLRTLALVDSGQLKLETVFSDLSTLAEHMILRFVPQAEKNNVRLIFTQPPKPFPTVEVDPQRIEQILSNLISNALRFTPAGGQIEVTLSSQPRQVSLQIHDSGTGIPEDSISMVFERFYRADKSRSRAEGGSGLGLAIARQLAEAHGGTLTAANHPQGGAVFTLTLPVRSGKPA